MPILMSHTDRDRNKDRNAFYLRSILESKIQVDLYAFVSMIVALSAFGSYLWVNLSQVSVIWWLGLVTLALILRVVVMYRKGRFIDSFDYLGLLRFRRALFACSLLMQSAMGSGIGVCCDNRKEREERSVQNIINIRKILPFRLRSMAPLFRILRLF